MGVVAGILGLLYAALHGVGAPRRSADAIPDWARTLWLVFVAITAVASVIVVFDASVLAVLLLAVGVLGIAALAVANGVWLHGRPHWQHHAVRLAFAALVLVPAVLAL